MIPGNWLVLASGGLFSGILAGFLGIGGGTVLVPLLVALGYKPVQAVATSTLAIVITAGSGTVQNWRMGYINPQQVIYLGLPALVTAQLGVYLANRFPSDLLLLAFGILLLVNIYLVELRQHLTAKQVEGAAAQIYSPALSQIATGGIAGLLAGLFGLGGGVILVPLQILLLGRPIKDAVQTSLGVIVMTAIAAAVGHTWSGNILFIEGILLGIGGLLGAQVSTRFLPRLPDAVVSLTFRALLVLLAIYTFWQAWQQQ